MNEVFGSIFPSFLQTRMHRNTIQQIPLIFPQPGAVGLGNPSSASSMSVDNSILGDLGGIANESEDPQESYWKLKAGGELIVNNTKSRMQVR